MFLVELVLQGVRRFKSLSRLRFQSGFNLITAGNESGKTTAVDTMLRLLFPREDGDAFAKLVSRGSTDKSIGALVIFPGQGSYYRIIQDFTKKGINVSKYNAATKEFVLQNKDWQGAAQFLSDMTAGMSEGDFERLFIFRREHYRAGAAVPASPVPSRTAAPAAAGMTVPSPRPGRASQGAGRLAELKEMLHKAEEAADADYRAQAAKLRLQEIEKKMEVLQDLEARYADIEAKLAGMKGCDSLPADLAQLIDEHERNQIQKMSEVDRIDQDIAGLRAQIEAVPRPNIAKDPLFIAGSVVGAGSVVAALRFLTTEQAALFPVGVVTALALIAGAWYKSSRKSAERKVLQKECDGLEAERAEVEKSLEKGGERILACMKATGVDSPAELKEIADNYRYFSGLLDEAAEQRDRMLSSTSADALQAEHARQEQEMLSLEKAARAVAHHNVDTYSLRQDIERIEQEMGISTGMSAPAAAWEFSSGEEAGPLSGAAVPCASSAGGGFLDELEIASRVGGIETETLLPAVAAAAQRNLAAVTNGAYVRVDIAPGNEVVVYGADNEKQALEDLSHSTSEALYFCLRAGLVEAVAGKLRLPFILDDPLAGFDSQRQKAACQVLRNLGGKTQVLLFASNPVLKAQGDAAAELK